MKPERYPIEAVEQALRQSHGLRSIAAQILKCSPTTVTNYLKRSKYLQQVEREIMLERLDRCELRLIKAFDDGEAWAINKYLNAKGQERGYGKVVVTGPDGGPIQHRHTVAEFEAMSDDELDDAIRRRAAKPR